MVNFCLPQVLWTIHLALTLANPISAPIVDLGYVRYRGFHNSTTGLTSYYGIRYAKAPVGQLRWRAPVPIDTHTAPRPDILNATMHGPSCIQSTPAWEPSASSVTVEGDEDCLLLDVITPSVPVSANLPVMVQIHGGGYVRGSSATYPGNALVYQSCGNLIYVSIQYRLGPFGFLAGDEVKADGIWNAGLLDQRAALHWVQRHIHQFGGDPSKVTTIGGSAGGGSVSMQMMLHGGVEKPPFRAAIAAEYPWWTPIYNDSWLAAQYSGFADAANCSSVYCLRNLSVRDLQRATVTSYQTAYSARQYAYGTFYWGPAVDGHAVPDYPAAAFRDGKFTKIPVLVDRDGFEGVSFTNFSLTTTAEVLADLSTLWPSIAPGRLAEILALYPASAYNGTALSAQPFFQVLQVVYGPIAPLNTAFARRQAVFGDALVECPTNLIAGAASARGLPAWKMVFNAGFQLHSATSAFLFSDPILGNTTFGPVLRDYFVSFAVELDPNRWATVANKTVWPRFEVGTESVLDVGLSRLDLRLDNAVTF
ncbi:alpha/beta-hydrolase [Cenococcum geophilum 1.58]|uniref:alpha/beta-hydrolase n=1 Tax=Cenococcum geophilum 1.58 TaxID=794803 RepID=UPI00358E96A0|nr:alpha/beta-hydrolase [Cenococcum geophilum 1.58]